ncbi:MAG: hypothetical protein ACKODY_09775 [Actinomycetota bacterium]
MVARSRPTRADVMAAALAAVGAIVVATVQLRSGIIHLLDTVTYWSGAQAVADGHPFTTHLAPSFSNFDSIEFLERGGRLPFVDFPIGFPLLAGIPGALIGVRRAMGLVSALSLAVVALCVVLGDRRPAVTNRIEARRLLTIFFAVALIALPTTRLITQGTLSEPVFTAAVFALVIALARYREGGRWRWVAGFTVLASLLRFIGAPLAILGGWERYRRTGERRNSLLWTIGLAAPSDATIAIASLAGGGHNAGWRGLQRVDVDVFVRSVGGWFDHRQGDLRRTYFTTEGPQWWSWIVTIAWVALLVVAITQLIRRRPFLTPTAHFALAAAGIVSAGLILGLMGFDALVIPDNRLMLPAGLLTLAALYWSSPGRGRALVGVAAVVVLWIVVAVQPTSIGESFSDDSDRKAFSEVAASSGARIIITNDADAVHWDTGLPAAYAPTARKALTGELVDVDDLSRRLPCALLRHDGIVVLSDQITFSSVEYDLLDLAVAEGALEKDESPGVIVYRPTTAACR